MSGPFVGDTHNMDYDYDVLEYVRGLPIYGKSIGIQNRKIKEGQS